MTAREFCIPVSILNAMFAARYPFPDHGAAYSHRRGGDPPRLSGTRCTAFQGAVIPEYREYPHNAENAGAQDSFHGRDGGIAHSTQCRRDFVKRAYLLENQDQHNPFAGHPTPGGRTPRPGAPWGTPVRIMLANQLRSNPRSVSLLPFFPDEPKGHDNEAQPLLCFTNLQTNPQYQRQCRRTGPQFPSARRIRRNSGRRKMRSDSGKSFSRTGI